MEDDIKRTILLEHYKSPHNFGLSSDTKYKLIHNASDSCIDDLMIQILFDGDLVKDVRFDGKGCTISMASTSIISDLIIGKSKKEAMNIINNYYNMIDEKEYDEDTLDEANAFDTLYKQPNRIKCGTIGIKAMEQLIKESYDK